MFRSSTIIREPALNLAKIIFALKYSVKLRRYLLCGCVAAWDPIECTLYCTCYTFCIGLMMAELRPKHVALIMN